MTSHSSMGMPALLLLACLLLAAAAIELADRLFSAREFCGKGEKQVI